MTPTRAGPEAVVRWCAVCRRGLRSHGGACGPRKPSSGQGPPLMLRHACDYALANRGHDRGHCKRISATATSTDPNRTGRGEIADRIFCGPRRQHPITIRPARGTAGTQYAYPPIRGVAKSLPYGRTSYSGQTAAVDHSTSRHPIELSTAPGPLAHGADTFRNRPRSSSGCAEALRASDAAPEAAAWRGGGRD